MSGVDDILNAYKDEDLSGVDDTNVDYLLTLNPDEIADADDNDATAQNNSQIPQQSQSQRRQPPPPLHQQQQQQQQQQQEPRQHHIAQHHNYDEYNNNHNNNTGNKKTNIESDVTVSNPTTIDTDDPEYINRLIDSTHDPESPKMSGNTLNDHLLSLKIDETELEHENDGKNLNRYNDIDLSTIEDPLKREEIRMKQNSEKCNYVMNQPLTQRRIDNAAHGKDTSFFKLSTLNFITGHINNYKSEYGDPTIVKAHYKFIGIGTQNGFIFIFDHSEKLQFVLSPSDQLVSQTTNKSDRCVTALDFSHNGSQLVVGHHGGQLVLWDVTSKKIIKFVKDAHTHPIIFVYFYKKGQMRVVTSDSKGIMQTWSFSKLFFSYQVDRSTLFNGKRAGILYDVALYVANPNYAHVLDIFSLCAVANAECVFFVTLDPARTLKQTIVHGKFDNCLPIVAWRLSYTPPTRDRRRPQALPQQQQQQQQQGSPATTSVAATSRGGRAPTRESNDNHLMPNGKNARTGSPQRNPSPAPPSRLPPPLPSKITPSPSPPGSPQPPLSSHVLSPFVNSVASDTTMTSNTTKSYQMYQRNPILAIAASMTIQLVEIYAMNEKQLQQTRDTTLIQVRGLGQVQLDDVIVGMKWLNEQKLVVITEKKHIEIIEGFPLRLSEVISRTPRALVTHKYFVDPIKRQMIECFQNALEIVQGLDRSGAQNKLLIVQSNQVTQAECVTWNDQISKLSNEGEWIKAFCLIIEFMEQYSQSKIAPNSNSSKQLLSKIEWYITEFAEYALKSIQSDSDLEMFCGVAMDYCVSVGRNSLLFTKVFDRLKDAGGREIFFKLLEPYILNDRIQSLPAEFLHSFVEYLRSKNSITSLEQIILHLSPTSFDFHQIIGICRDYQLFTALCYIHNNAFKDFGEPIRDMYELIITPLKKQLDLNRGNHSIIDNINQKGFHLLLYLTYILNGTTFPWCQTLKIPTKAKQSVLNVLFNTKTASKYDVLRFLIDLDLSQTLKCLALCFDDKHLFSKMGSASKKHGGNDMVTSPSPQHHTNNNNHHRPRRTSVQIKDMLFNAQSAVVSSAKWAWSVGTGSTGQSQQASKQQQQHMQQRQFAYQNDPLMMNQRLSLNRTESDVRNAAMGLIGSDDPSLDYSLDANITIPDRQEMMNVLVNILFKEKSDSIVASSYDVNKMNQECQQLFYQFCTPYLAAGVCDISNDLLQNALKFLFAEAIRVNQDIIENEKMKQEFENKESFVSNLLLSPDMGANVAVPPSIPEDTIDIGGGMGHETDDEEISSFNKDIKRVDRQLKELRHKKLHLENTVLVILSRKLDEDKHIFDLKDLIRQAQSCKFHKIELYLHKLSGNHDAVIDAYFNDEDMRSGVFRYIHNLFYDIQSDLVSDNNNNSNVNSKNAPTLPGTNIPITPYDTKNCSSTLFGILQLTLKRLDKLVEINAYRACQLVFTWFPYQFEDALNSLEKSSIRQYEFLKEVIIALEKKKQQELVSAGLSSKKKSSSVGVGGKKTPKDVYTTEGLLSKHKHIYGNGVSPSPDTTLGDRSSVTMDSNNGNNNNNNNGMGNDNEDGKNNSGVIEQKSLEMLLVHYDFELDKGHHETYIRLLCEHSERDVLAYLETHATKYDIKKAQRYCQKYHVLDASAYLKERSGDPIGALDLIMEALKGNIAQLWDEYQNKAHVIPDRSKRQSHLRLASSMDLQNLTTSVDKAKIVSDQLTMAINLCQSYTKKQESDEKTQHTLWNSLLDNCLSMQQEINEQLKLPQIVHKYKPKVRVIMKETGNELVSKVLSEMMSERIDLCKIFMKVVDKGSSEQFGYYRDTINVMLSTYRYETNMMQCAKNLFQHGCYNTYSEMLKTASKAYRTSDKTQHSHICRICEKYLKDLPPSLDSNDNSNPNTPGSSSRSLTSDFGLKSNNNNINQRIKIFACGHGFHDQCLAMTSMHMHSSSELQCPICSELTQAQRAKMEDATRLANQQRRKEAHINDAGDTEHKSFVNQNRGNLKQKTDLLDRLEDTRQVKNEQSKEKKQNAKLDFDETKVKLKLGPQGAMIGKLIDTNDIKTAPQFSQNFERAKVTTITIDA